MTLWQSHSIEPLKGGRARKNQFIKPTEISGKYLAMKTEEAV